MGLSRLDNFLKSTRGTILYVDPSSLDATDSIENTGNSLTRPFKTIQRALIESARFSYQRGLDNDRFAKTSILLYPGEHVVDNRPGFIPFASNQYYQRDGGITNDLPPFDLNSNFDLESEDNELYKLNSIHGGVILPRGTSIVGLDLRKTKIRPKYVPDPQNSNIDKTALFRVTGACYLWQFSIFDGDPNGVVYKDYTKNKFVPNFSHHKLTCFEYADGVNAVNINDSFLTYSTTRTDLDMYYEKVGLVYGQSSGRAISPDFPSSGVDIQPKIDEYRIVGSTGGVSQITSIQAGDGTTATTTITVILDSGGTATTGLEVDSPFRIEGISAVGYNGTFVVSEKVNATTIKYQVQNAPTIANPSATGGTLTLSSDTVTSASPYIFNTSLRSVFGMNGMHADGSKATGFRSMVVAQFTGISLQKDENAFVRYNQDSPPTGVYDDNTKAGNETLSNSSRSRYKPEYRNYHVKVSNNSFIQAVSIFAVGYSEHFVTENGGDISLTNSNSNFGANALTSSGFRSSAFNQDNTSFISHIYPPKQFPLTENSLEFVAVDVAKTDSVAGVGSTSHLYLYEQTNKDAPPENILEGFRVGARVNDQLNILIPQAGVVKEFSARIIMEGSRDVNGTEYLQSTSEKSFNVNRVSGINSIGSNSDGQNANVITLERAHNFINGETVRVIGETGQVPDGLEPNTVYHVVTNGTGITTNTNIRLAKTLNDAINATTNVNEAITINGNGGLLKIVSRVSDKNPGDIGHPIQYDTTQSQWYIKVASASTENNIFSTIVGLGTTALGDATPRSFIKRRNDSISSNDTLYRLRYVIPSDGSFTARPPVEGYILQESSTSIGSTDGEIQTYFGSGSLSNKNEQRNFRFIANAEWSGGVAKITSELPHNLSVGSGIELFNVKSTNNTAATQNDGFNRNFVVSGISSAKQFSVGLSTDPGTFSSDTTTRTTSLPHFTRKTFNDTYYVYRISEAQEYISGDQDGIYYLTVLNASNSPTVAPFTAEEYSQPVKRMFPQTDRDNPVADPKSSKCFAESETIGLVEINDAKNSITRETIDKYVKDNDIGFGIVDIVSSTGFAHTINTSIDHGLNRVLSVGIVTGGVDYGTGGGSEETYYNARLVGIGTSVTGKHATAKVTVSAAGTISNVVVMDGGSAYGIGNTMQITGVTTSGTGHVAAVVQVNTVYDNVGEVIRIAGVSSESYEQYNNLYRITEIGIGSDTHFNVSSASSIAGFTTSIGETLTSGAHAYVTGKSIKVSSFVYDFTSGIATVNTTFAHGLSADNKVTITGAANTAYNGSFVVTEDVSQTRIKVNIGVGTVSPTESSSSIFILPEGFGAQDGNVTVNDENVAGRMVAPYAGITTTISSSVTALADNFDITGLNLGKSDIKIGDYLQIESEVVRVKETVATGSANIKLFRGVLGTRAESHSLGTVIRRIKPFSTELRRHSIIRASGHTFEYVGFGPGNYSTAFPDKHDRAITNDEELLAQSNKRAGGINFYTGMNDKGISYSGNKKLSTITGREEIFDTPVRTITGEDILEEPAINVINPVEGVFLRSLKVEGGPDNKTTSEFNGPVIINNKVTVNSANGLETNNLFIQGDATVSRNFTVGISAPVLAGNPGNVILKANPAQGGSLGYVYTTDNAWRAISPISLDRDQNIYIFDKIGIGTTGPGDNRLQVGSGSSLFAVNSHGASGVGIGTTANEFKLHVIGESRFSGSIVATAFTGDGSGLSNLANDSLFTTVPSGIGTGISPNDVLNVGIGTTRPLNNVNLTVGAVGASGTSLFVRGEARFTGIITANNLIVSGFTTITNYDINNSSGQITAGIITSTNLNVGVGSTTISTIGVNIGLGTAAPRSKVDIQGRLRTTAVSENVVDPSVSSNVMTVDLDQGSVFDKTLDDDTNIFKLVNIPSDGGTFTIKLTQDSTGGHAALIDVFQTEGGSTIPVYWPGGVLPVMTSTASKTDIYSFKFFDGSAITSDGLYGVVGGQNFG